ncbi:butyrophilin subfamily 2 member A1-like isoform X2 [Seriola lalandi dorsalis]|uniref:butyrophilin subfamily 2 member A1-like isoform X2 n=1 Tax=Seriola lalandi dorsalis TaxID=1841481 RepID=UPI000C6FC649|nr:butyrophilin subfamily 2 member A1-like isoform X2 [Seriola lalandi dorsalis]
MRLFTVLFSALPLILGKYDVICPTETIQAEEGDDVTLRFDLDPRVNLSDYTLDVTRTDLNEVKLDEVVHAYRHGKDLTDPQTERYRHRTILIHEDLSRGIITLQISSVQLKDSGPYRCFVPELRAGCTTVLNVVQHNKTKTDDVMTSTSPPNPDAETVNVGAVVAGVLVPVLIIIIIIVLVKRGTIRRSVERLRGRREEEPEKEKKKENLENSAETAC